MKITKFLLICTIMQGCNTPKYDINRSISEPKKKEKQQEIDTENPKIFQEVTVDASDSFIVDIEINQEEKDNATQETSLIS
jgi:hypothetical protein